MKIITTLVKTFVGGTVAAAMLTASAISVQAQDLEPISPIALFHNGWNDTKLRENGQEENYEAFLAQNFYGALAMSKDGYSYWYAGFHDIETARTAVIAWCEDDSPPEGIPCTIAAYLVPSEVPEGFIHGLSATAEVEFDEFMSFGDQKAYAISPNGAYAFTWDYGSKAEAEREAINLCNESAQAKSDWVIGQSASCVLFDYLSATGQTSTEQLLQRPNKK